MPLCLCECNIPNHKLLRLRNKKRSLPILLRLVSCFFESLNHSMSSVLCLFIPPLIYVLFFWIDFFFFSFPVSSRRVPPSSCPSSFSSSASFVGLLFFFRFFLFFRLFIISFLLLLSLSFCLAFFQRFLFLCGLCGLCFLLLFLFLFFFQLLVTLFLASLCGHIRSPTVIRGVSDVDSLSFRKPLQFKIVAQVLLCCRDGV
mmetsp:Transcript_14940/g.21793  ORF Transcript_14940/g.21793 Transcript_14940/m.21793 type:complete len:201 (-) Transcript_14940:944-1546(-)